jgi:hypothetical protein
MSKFDPRRVSMRRTMIAVVASLALGTTTMTTGTMALAHGGGGGHFGGGGGGHFGGGFGNGHFGRSFGGGHFGGHFGGRFAGDRFDRGFRHAFGGLYGFGGGELYYDYGYSDCYVLTPSGYGWICY